jgi:hypothetical protein
LRIAEWNSAVIFVASTSPYLLRSHRKLLATVRPPSSIDRRDAGPPARLWSAAAFDPVGV